MQDPELMANVKSTTSHSSFSSAHFPSNDPHAASSTALVILSLLFLRDAQDDAQFERSG